MMKVTILGGGAWGTALASEARRAGHQVTLWCRDPELAQSLRQGRNPKYLPGLQLPDGLAATMDRQEAVQDSDAVLIAVPAQAVRETMTGLSLTIPMALCAKGIERGSLKLLTTVLSETVPDAPLCVLSGPSFASEVARGLPGAITLAGLEGTTTGVFRDIIGRGVLRAYLSDDPIGAETGGALKNVIAIAAGIALGRGLGENARAALVSRGLAEIARLTRALGGRAETVMGLSGAGDLILSAMSETSRNTAFGMALGRGDIAPTSYRTGSNMTEGAWTAQAAKDLAFHHEVDMPICVAVADILAERMAIDQAIGGLLERPSAAEFRP